MDTLPRMTTDLEHAAVPPFDPPPQGVRRPAPADWVPVDERVLGFDRKTIWPGVVLLVVWALWAHVMPFINNSVNADNPIVSGDVINLSAGELTFVPAVGWNLDAGLLLTPTTKDRVGVPSNAAVSSDVVQYSVKTGNWDGTPDALLDQMIDVNENLGQLVIKQKGGRADITNADGVPGRLAYIVGPNDGTLFAAYVFETKNADGSTGKPIGVEIEVRGQPGNIQDVATEVAKMIDSTTYRTTQAEAKP
jgi:hypothetical protein